MKFKINLEIAPLHLRQLIDLVSDAQNKYAERISMMLCRSCATDEERQAQLSDITFLRCRYDEYTALLKMLHDVVSDVDAIRPPEADE